MREDHLAFRDFTQVYNNFTKDKVFLYQSKQFLENEIRMRLTNCFGETEAHIARECPEIFHVALGMAKYSPFKRFFDERIQWLVESGIESMQIGLHSSSLRLDFQVDA